MNNKYRTYIPSIEHTVSLFEQQYLYDPHVKQPLHIRFLVWLARKTKVQSEMSIRYETINLDLISDLIFENIHAMTAVLNREAGYIVIGRDKFDYLQIELDATYVILWLNHRPGALVRWYCCSAKGYQ